MNWSRTKIFIWYHKILIAKQLEQTIKSNLKSTQHKKIKLKKKVGSNKKRQGTLKKRDNEVQGVF
jgi:hypothetical protein